MIAVCLCTFSFYAFRVLKSYGTLPAQHRTPPPYVLVLHERTPPGNTYGNDYFGMPVLVDLPEKLAYGGPEASGHVIKVK